MLTPTPITNHLTNWPGLRTSALLSFLGELTPLLILLVIVLILFFRNVRIVPQAQNYVIERLGTYKATWDTGLHIKIPFIDRVAKVVSLKENVYDYPPQAVITKDNVTMQIDTVLFYQITDPKLFVYGIENPAVAMENLAATTLRNIIGDLELDDTLTSRDLINARMRETLDEATDPWGIKVNRVELKNIVPPQDIQTAMEKQMKAEREKRESILRAEGKKDSAILVAKGEREAAILKADAKKESMIREAQGEAMAILEVQEATAKGLQLLKDVAVDSGVIALRSLATMEKVADGRATKIIVPSELQNLATLGTVLKEVAGGNRDDATAPGAPATPKQTGSPADKALSYQERRAELKRKQAEREQAGENQQPDTDGTNWSDWWSQ